MTGRDEIDFAGLAAALLDRAPTLVPLWLPGRRDGHEWVGLRTSEGGPGDSWRVNLVTGAWAHFAGDERGGDLVSFYAAINRLGQAAAARQLLRDNGWAQSAVQTPASPPAAPARKARPEWAPIAPVPGDAPPYRSQWGHYARGVPNAHWEYRDRDGRLLGVVCRFDKSDGSKDVQPLSYCQGSHGRREWRYKAFGQPRPLYGLHRLPADLADRVVVVTEGEKKCDRLHEALGPGSPVVSWAGGCKVPAMSDWSPLQRARGALLWPDADAQIDKTTGEMLPAERQPGLQAMRKVQALLEAMGVPVKIIDTGPPGTRADGWDAADAIAEGWTREQLLAFMAVTLPDPAQERAPDTAPAPAPASTGGGGAGGSPPSRAGAGRGGEGDDWRDRYIRARGQVRECVPNVMLVLHEHPAWHGVLGFDEFSQRVVKRAPAPFDDPARPSSEWTDVDDTRAAAWIARQEQWVPGAHMVAEAATEVAHANRFHPVLQYLQGLQHDGIDRLEHWLIDNLGVVDTPYTRKVSRYFLIGMCMRVLHPGCKFDYCLVLEGPQGRGKSSALRVLGGEWFSDTELDLANKDAMSNIRGKWLHEFGEMGSLARSESNRQKSFLSRQVDEFRPTYGRREIRCPRQTGFAGSTNEWSWNKDPTGGRRFWPVEVGDDINVPGLAAIRDQLFAEAFAAAQAGERYWPAGDEQRELFDPEQLAREQPDAFMEMLDAWLSSDVTCGPEFTLSDACIKGLKLDAKTMTKDIQTRVGIALRKLGCTRHEHRLAKDRFVYKRPQRNAASSQATGQAEEGVEEVPF